MDEILIEEKKYVSSKRAAKVTGYAKDYIGQLCREGRVPARLVGRSWYVLESAIHDHRFGNPEPKIDTNEESKQTLTSNWESPRYEAFKAEILPSINRLHPAPGLSTGNNVNSYAVDDQNEAPQHLQDSWRAWFDHAATTKPVSLSSEPEKQEEEKEPEEPEEVSIPIHTVYELPPEDLLPQYRLEVESTRDEEEMPIQKRGDRGMIRAIQISGTVCAVLAVTLAVIGTGYLDKYILSNSQVGLIAGVALYNR